MKVTNMKEKLQLQQRLYSLPEKTFNFHQGRCRPLGPPRKGLRPHGSPKRYKKSLKVMMATYGSIIYNGVLTWALDPLFPHARIKYINNIPHISGECSDKRILTKDECLECGTCSGSGCEGHESAVLCEQSKDLFGSTCEWSSCNTFQKENTFHPGPASEKHKRAFRES